MAAAMVTLQECAEQVRTANLPGPADLPGEVSAIGADVPSQRGRLAELMRQPALQAIGVEDAVTSAEPARSVNVAVITDGPMVGADELQASWVGELDCVEEATSRTTRGYAAYLASIVVTI